MGQGAEDMDMEWARQADPVASRPAELADIARVRPLVWEPMKRNTAAWTATCPVSGHLYRAFDEADKQEQDARRIARILAALEPAPALMAELVEAVEEAIEALDYSAAEIADLENTLSSYRENWRDAKDAAVSLRAALAKLGVR